MSKTVLIPDCMSPFIVMVNGVEYVCPAGEMVEVPDDVALVIEQHQKYHDEIEKINNGEGNQGGGGGGSTEPVNFLTQVETMTIYKDETSTRIPENAFAGCKNLKVLDFTKLEFGWYGIVWDGDTYIFEYTLPPIPWRAQAIVNRGGMFQAGFKESSECYPEEDSWTSNVHFCNQLYVYIPREFIVEENFINRGGDQWDEENYSNFAYGADWEVWWNKNRIRAIEDYTVDGTVTGELDLAKMGIS